MKDCSPLNSRKICDKIHFQAIQSESSDAFSDQSPTIARPPGLPIPEPDKPPMEMQFANEEDVEALGAAAPPLPTIEEPKPLSASVAPTASKMDSPSRKKGGRAGGSQQMWGSAWPEYVKGEAGPGQLSAEDVIRI